MNPKSDKRALDGAVAAPPTANAARKPRLAIMTTPVATERNIEHLIYRVAEILAAEWDVTLVGLYETTERMRARFPIYAPRDAAWRWRRLPVLGTVYGRVRMLRRYVRRERPALLLALSGIGVNGLATAITGRLSGVPTLVRVNSDVFAVWRHQRTLSRKLALFAKNNVLGRLAILFADRTILLHEAQRQSMREAGFRDDRFVVGPPPAEFPDKPPREESRRRIRERLGIPEDAFVVVYVGRVDPDKNFELFADVVRRALQRRADAHVLIVGSGSKRAYLEAALHGQRASFVDQVPRDALPQYYLAADLYLTTSPSEGLSVAILEALYHDLPVVSTDSGIMTRAMVSNIGRSADDLAAFIVGDSYRRDPFPDNLSTAAITRSWLELTRAARVE